MDFTYYFPEPDVFMNTLRKYFRETGRDDIATLLLNSTCYMSQSSSYSHRRWNEYLASIVIYVPVEYIARFTDEIKQELLKTIDLIFPKEAGFYICEVDISPLLESSQARDETQITAHFEEIRERIIEQIDGANFLIWVAVAWFTDRTFFERLRVKKNEGVNVQILIIDDEINRNSGLRYEDIFETYRKRPTEVHENIMHHKFCIIDMKTVIHGGYNWTNRARYNDEDITITHNYGLAEEYATQFMRLKREVLAERN